MKFDDAAWLNIRKQLGITGWEVSEYSFLLLFFITEQQYFISSVIFSSVPAI